MPSVPGIRVVRSPIHGYGLVATRDFAVGDVITYVEGILYLEEDLKDDTYALWMDDGRYFDMVDQTRWTNHSCDPNGEIEADFDDAGVPWARIIAIKPIRAGEELTYDYAFIAELAEPCACGAATCRGLIIDVEEIPRLEEVRGERRKQA